MIHLKRIQYIKTETLDELEKRVNSFLSIDPMNSIIGAVTVVSCEEARGLTAYKEKVNIFVQTVASYERIENPKKV